LSAVDVSSATSVLLVGNRPSLIFQMVSSSEAIEDPKLGGPLPSLPMGLPSLPMTRAKPSTLLSALFTPGTPATIGVSVSGIRWRSSCPKSLWMTTAERT
jgi:hypothetical protein